ncbi:conserved hypothetical protein [Pantoea brenneri]|uniref:Uncharacterized protein n=1 Tax=Pantoea brenneri TaxID=472694 RepID=A0AAX3J7N2_9GAMM|nr:conserved hypothetical protein [Pantoea brenneri]
MMYKKMRYLVHSMQEESRFTDKKIVVMAIKLNKRQFNNVFIVESIMKCIFWLKFSRKRGRVIGRKEGTHHALARCVIRKRHQNRSISATEG